MKDSIIIGLVQNTAILLAFSMLYENFWIKNDIPRSIGKKLIIGLILSGIGIVLMYTPWTLMPGIVFDTRSVMISISGLFFGPTPTVITMLIMSLVRLFIGGDGQWMGIAVIISSGTIGLLWRYFRSDWSDKKPYLELLSLGFIVHVVMSLCTFFLPTERMIPTLKTIALPLIFIYSPATMLLGIVMLRQYKNKQNRLAQLKLVETEKRLSEVLESGNIISLILNTDGSIKYCNDYLLQLTGYSHEEIIGKNWFETFIPAEIQSTIKTVFFNSIDTKKVSQKYENEILTKDGNIKYISWYNTVFHSDANEVTGIASIGVNITNIIENEKKLEDRNKEYQEINRRLTEAKEKAEESERLKTAFLQNMSHEIRTPMNAIYGFTSILDNPNLPKEKLKSYITIIHNSSKQLLSIVEDILTISSLETKQEKLNIQKTDINSILLDLVAIYKIQAYNKGLIFNTKMSLSGKSAEIYTDKTKLIQILTNLITNSLKFTSSGYIEFGYTVGTGGTENRSDVIMFYVKDSGIGIDADLNEKIFERFTQADKNIQATYGGTGLGLSISKGLVELLGGIIWVESEHGKGSSFYFTIPYKPVDEKFRNPAHKLRQDIKTILIAEDEEYNYLLIEEYLNDLELKLIRSKDGKETIEIFKNTPNIDLILMDIKMPIIPGDEAAMIIKQLNKDVPIVAQSAYALKHELAKYEKVFDDYLTKPLSKKDLQNTIKKFIDVKSQTV